MKPGLPENGAHATKIQRDGERKKEVTVRNRRTEAVTRRQTQTMRQAKSIKTAWKK